MNVQRSQCCVFLNRKDKEGLMGAFRPFGFDEHSAITWEDFAKFSHRVYVGLTPLTCVCQRAGRSTLLCLLSQMHACQCLVAWPTPCELTSRRGGL